MLLPLLDTAAACVFGVFVPSRQGAILPLFADILAGQPAWFYRILCVSGCTALVRAAVWFRVRSAHARKYGRPWAFRQLFPCWDLFSVVFEEFECVCSHAIAARVLPPHRLLLWVEVPAWLEN